MQTENLISASIFCSSHSIEHSFITHLHQYGLIEVTAVDEEVFIHTDDLTKLEQFTRFYYDMQINFEGIQAISHLLEQLRNQQQEINMLRNKLLASSF